MGYVVQDHPCLNATYGKDVCFFRWANGGVLSITSVIGVLLNTFVMFIIAIARVKLPGHQNICMFNLAISNLILSVLGVFRGLGIMFPIFVHGGDNSSPNQLCGIFAVTLNTLGQSNTVSLVPLTLERFSAIVYPFHHRYFFTRTKCIILILAVWTTKIVYIVTYMKLWVEGVLKTEFYFNYHRCITSGAKSLFLIRYVGFTFIPFGLIILMYAIMIWKVRAEKLSSRRMLAVTFFIILTGIIAWFPSIITNFGSIKMNYEVSQILTVTLFYFNSVTDPIIYILGYPSVKRYIRTMVFLKGKQTGSRSSCIIQSGTHGTINNDCHVTLTSMRRATSYHLRGVEVNALRSAMTTPSSEQAEGDVMMMSRFGGGSSALRSISRRHSADSIYENSLRMKDRTRLTQSVTQPDMAAQPTIEES